MKRRQFVRAIGGAAAAMALARQGAGAEESGLGRPNILLAISDDQSWCHTHLAGDPVVKTPTFDRVAREGVYFPCAFCSSPSCSFPPSGRSSPSSHSCSVASIHRQRTTLLHSIHVAAR